MRIYSDAKMNGLEEKIEESKKALRLAAEMSKEYYKAPLIITYSGGKDSDVMLHLAESCLKPVEFEVLNSHTSVDAPQTVYHIRKVFKRMNERGIKATEHYPLDENGKQITMWSLIPQKLMPPTRMVRYCCAVLKETSTPNRLCSLGVREDESTGRQGRDIFTIRGKTKKDAKFYSLDHAEEVFIESNEIQDEVFDCTLITNMKQNNDVMINPIYKWTEQNIWQYVKQNSIEMNPLYSMGYKRVGCVGCPLATYEGKMKEFRDFPTYKQAYINAFEKMLQERKIRGLKTKWNTGEEVYLWWIEEYRHNCKGQMNMSDFMN